ncbi:MAG: OmpA family protein, partial [Acidimicrobiales bacterium]
SAVLYAQWSGHKPAMLFGAVGVFRKNSAALSTVLKNQITRLALTVMSRKYRTVTLYGYTATTGLSSLNASLSRSRAQNVANFLRRRLTLLKVKRVTIKSAGEGAIVGESTAAYSRVEVFGV